MLKRILSITIIAVMLISASFTFAAAATVIQSQSVWKDSLDKLSLMGIVDEADLNINGNITREQFSKIIINSTGNYDLAKSLTGSTTFSDVSSKSAYCGYINAAVNKSFLSAYSDGNFKPDAHLTFAQLCTAMIKALGYQTGDIIGAWPNGYVDKARNLGITNGFSYSSNNPVKTGDAIQMIEKMLNTYIKKANAQDADKTLLDSSGLMDDQQNWVYGKPEVALNFKPASGKLGSITFEPNIPILRDTVNNSVSPSSKTSGETISIDDIKDKDVVYEVYNKLNILMYYLVVDNKIDGQITSILPSKYSPKKVQLNNVDYELSEYATIGKFNSNSGTFNVGDSVTLILGYDQKIIDTYYMRDDNNKDYAFVVNCATMVSKEAADYGSEYFTVELLHVDGSRKTYKVKYDPYLFRWKLVKYSLINDDTVALLSMQNNTNANLKIDKLEKKIGNSYVTDNVKIFNYTESTVELVRWSDMPEGVLATGKVKYQGVIGDFNDVNVMLVNDVFNKQDKDWVVQSIQLPVGSNGSFKYNLISGTSQYTYTSKEELPDIVKGSVISMKMKNDTVVEYNHVTNSEDSGWYVQAIDSKRVKINNIIFPFSNNLTVYFNDYSGNLTVRSLSDIKTGPNPGYGSIKIYTDRRIDNGGKVQMLIFNLK